MSIDEDEIRRRVALDTQSRRRRRRGVSIAVAAATLVVVPLIFRALGSEPWQVVTHATLVATVWMVLALHMVWRDRFLAPDAVEVEPVEVVAVRGREVVVQTDTGRRLRWPVARRGPAPPTPGARLWASAPVRRFHRSTLLAADADSPDGLTMWRPTYEALAEGPADVVTIDPASTPVERRRQARVRAADPAQLLADARRRASTRRRELLLVAAVFATLIVSTVHLWVTVPDFHPNVGAVLAPMLLLGAFGRGSYWGIRDLARSDRLVPVDFEARPAGDEVFARDAAGSLYAWRSDTAQQAWPAARTGPGWVTAPLREGRRVTIVDPGGFVGALSTVRAVPDP